MKHQWLCDLGTTTSDWCYRETWIRLNSSIIFQSMKHTISEASKQGWPKFPLYLVQAQNTRTAPYCYKTFRSQFCFKYSLRCGLIPFPDFCVAAWVSYPLLVPQYPWLFQWKQKWSNLYARSWNPTAEFQSCHIPFTNLMHRENYLNFKYALWAHRQKRW